MGKNKPKTAMGNPPKEEQPYVHRWLNWLRWTQVEGSWVCQYGDETLTVLGLDAKLDELVRNLGAAEMPRWITTAQAQTVFLDMARETVYMADFFLRNALDWYLDWMSWNLWNWRFDQVYKVTRLTKRGDTREADKAAHALVNEFRKRVERS